MRYEKWQKALAAASKVDPPPGAILNLDLYKKWGIKKDSGCRKAKLLVAQGWLKKIKIKHAVYYIMVVPNDKTAQPNSNSGSSTTKRGTPRK
jgi:hypothetical protein